MSKAFRSFLVLSVLLCLFSCAIQVAPGGGDKDVKPPVIEKMIPENYSTGFNGHDFSIRFDEFIQLKDIQTQLIVSPPLANQPETKVRKKTLFVHFDDTLREHSTYTFNFGNAILDNNEGNVLENFQYVVSTGENIDSLQINGKVANAFDGKTEKGILVMLYSAADDSIPYKERPFYFGKTNDAGEFSIKNISSGSYKIFALKTAGNDYQYKAAGESIAFSDSMVAAGTRSPDLQLFTEQPKFQILRSYSEYAGKAVIVGSGALDTVAMNWITDTVKLGIYALSYSKNKDSLSIWYKNLVADSLQLSTNLNNKTDTLSIRLFRFEGKQNIKNPFVFSSDIAVSMIQPQELHLPFRIQFNHPVKQVDFSKIIFQTDSQQVSPLSMSFADSIHRQLDFRTVWKEVKSYHLFIPPGTIEDIFGLKNDSLLLDFRTRELTDYGTVAIQFSGINDGSSRVLQLVDEKDQLFREAILSKDSLVQFQNLLPGSYRLKLISDGNKNGKWDTGNYLKKVQPEEVRYYPDLITVRANWDVDVKWNLSK